MTVEQIGATEDSITVEVSGITSGDRQTYIALTPAYISSYSKPAADIEEWIDNHNVDNMAWYTLSGADGMGIIRTVETNVDENNGSITIYFNTSHRLFPETKGWYIKVENIRNNSVYKSARIVAFTEFVYEGVNVKQAGEPIDITAKDMLNIDMHCFQIGYLSSPINTDDFWLFNSYFDELIGLVGYSGGEIKAKYMYDPALTVCDVADLYTDNISLYNLVYNNAYDIYDRCNRGSDFEAQFFEEMRLALKWFRYTWTA